MTSASWDRIQALFDELIALPKTQRTQRIQALQGEDPALAAELESLLRGHDELRGPLDKPPPFVVVDGDAGTADNSLAPGQRIGPYELVRPLGEGGMGSVWLAERVDGRMKRSVALKLPKWTWTLRNVNTRLARERDILASLEHAGIARLYDAGVDELGRPYLAMEYIQGEPIDNYCNSRSLTVPERLRLMLQVARAVAYAHSRLVVHRDLKPSNILVSDDGTIRLLDFGIAKLLLTDEDRASSSTQLGGRLFTLAYAAPEQIKGDSIGTPTDVYALGCVLYELIAASSPYKLPRRSSAALEEAIVTGNTVLASNACQNPTIARQLRGDLDAILNKALKKDPTDRYASIDAFADDITRFLRHEPIIARPDNRWYRLRKFARRNRLSLGAASFVSLSVFAGAGVALWQANRAEQQRALAVARLAHTEAANDFMFAVLTESVSADEKISLRELVERSERLALSDELLDSTARAVATEIVAGWFNSYGENERAATLVRRTLAALPANFNPSISATLRCKLANALGSVGKNDLALTEFANAIETTRRVDPATASDCLALRAMLYRNINRASDALADVQESLRFFQSSRRESPVLAAQLQSELGYVYSITGKTSAADRAFAESMRYMKTAGRAESPQAVTMINNWGIALLAAGSPRKALELFDQAAEIAKRRSPSAALPGYLLGNKANALRTLGLFDAARSEYLSMLVSARTRQNPREELYALVGIAGIHATRGESSESQKLLDDAHSLVDKSQLLTGGPAGFGLRFVQAQVLMQTGKYAAARTALTSIIDEMAANKVRVSITVVTALARGDLALAEKRPEEAWVDASKALAMARELQGGVPASNLTAQALLSVAKVQQARGKIDEARQAISEARNHFSTTVDPSHPLALEANELHRILTAGQ